MFFSTGRKGRTDGRKGTKRRLQKKKEGRTEGEEAERERKKTANNKNILRNEKRKT
jgi:hypothetical protein